MIFVEDLESTPENIKNLVQSNPKNLQEFFTKDNLQVKKVCTTILYKKNFTEYKHHLNTGAEWFLKSLHKPRLDTLVEYDKNAKAYNFPQDVSEQFDGAKLHWLVNDVKISGLGYPPQGYTTKTQFVCHPGTYRFLGAFAQQIKADTSVWDNYNEFKPMPLKLQEWINFCSNGFIRKHRYITIKLDDFDDTHRETPRRFLEIHETKNHHDHNIFNQDRALGEIYNYGKPTIYCASERILKQVKEFIGDESNYNFGVTSANPFLIPSRMGFKGVAMYIGQEGILHNPFDLLFLYLDINDDVAYLPEAKLMIFNNSSHNCKKLIPEIVNESTPEYLEEFKWASKTSTIPESIGFSL